MIEGKGDPRYAVFDIPVSPRTMWLLKLAVAGVIIFGTVMTVLWLKG